MLSLPVSFPSLSSLQIPSLVMVIKDRIHLGQDEETGELPSSDLAGTLAMTSRLWPHLSILPAILPTNQSSFPEAQT